MRPIYLDHNATTPVDESVLDTMLPWFRDRFWNPASAHEAGVLAAQAVDEARHAVAELIGGRKSEIVITSGSTESNNLALKGSAAAKPGPRNKIVVSAIEHKATLDTALSLQSQGFDIELVPVDADGTLRLDALSRVLDERVLLVSVMLANNETGVIEPVANIAAMSRQVGAIVHTDATQAVGKISVDVSELDVDLLSLSAHKFYGPKGVGALWVRRGVHLAPQMHGGGHERGLRSGTLNVPGAVGLGAASRVATDYFDKGEGRRQAALIDKLLSELRERLGQVDVISASAKRVPNTVCVRFPGADAEAVMANAPGVFVSSGSACTSRVPEPSHVLRAMGLSVEEAYECLRISVGRDTQTADIAEAATRLIEAVRRVRSYNENSETEGISIETR